MNPTYREVLDAALALSEADRAAIAQELLATLTPEGEGPSDDELAEELGRRLEEARNNPEASVAWSDMRDER
jgi:putative addiction module component (TIGR02574 family)